MSPVESYASLYRRDVTPRQFSLISWPLPLLRIISSRSFIFFSLIYSLFCLFLSPSRFSNTAILSSHPSPRLPAPLYVLLVPGRDKSDHTVTENCLQLTTVAGTMYVWRNVTYASMMFVMNPECRPSEIHVAGFKFGEINGELAVSILKYRRRLEGIV